MSGMTERNLRISNGKIAREGLYRDENDPNAKAYAAQVATGVVDIDCVFCPESVARRKIEMVDKIGTKVLGLTLLNHFYVIQAAPAYAHFEGHRVIDHKLIIPYEHVKSEHELSEYRRRKLGRYIREKELAAEEGTFVQSFTRSDRNYSKSVEHLHTHLWTLSAEPVARFSYDIDEGVTELTFARITPAQIQALERSRRTLEI